MVADAASHARDESVGSGVIIASSCNGEDWTEWVGGQVVEQDGRDGQQMYGASVLRDEAGAPCLDPF